MMSPAVDAHRERRLVTCLFVDIVGSTDSTLRLGPERMQRLLSEAFTEISSVVAEHGGTVEKYIGDAVLALFGVPTAHADDPMRALRAAHACVVWTKAEDRATTTVAVRIGIESGEVLVDLDAVDHRQQIAVGAAVNLAARLEQAAEPGEILVGPTCHAATADVADFDSLGTLSLKGIGDVEAWRFVDFTAEGVKPIAFVGRDEELSQLQPAFERARAGIGSLAVIIGPPGQGKTRLALEAIQRWRPDRLIEARCRPGNEVGSNTPLLQLLAADIPEPTPDRVAARISELLGNDEGSAVAIAVCHSAGIATDPRLLALPRIDQRETIAEAWQRYIGALARDALLVVWIEDLHWADPVLMRIVDRASTDLQATVLVVCTARPEVAGSAPLRARENRFHLELKPLDPERSLQLAQLAGDGTDGAERAGGNPLFIIELSRARARSRAEEIPMTIQAAIEARLDELEPSDRELLQRASVAGETFDIHDATLLGQAEPSEAAAAMGRIAHLGFIVIVGSAYRFHHALVRDVAYGRLPIAERMHLHATYAREGVDPGDPVALAHHWWLALDPSEADWVWEDAEALAAMRRQAFDAHVAAGRRLEERNAYEESLEVYSHAVDLTDDPITRAVAETALGRAFARNARGDEAWEHRLRAIAVYDEASTEPPASLYADMLEIPTMNWGYFKRLPEDAEVLRLLDEGVALARASGDEVSLARLLVERAWFSDDLTDTDDVIRLLRSPDPVRFGDAAHRMAQTLYRSGEITRAVDLYETVFERLIPMGATINEPEALMWHTVSVLHSGDLGGADALADRLLMDSLRRSPHTRQHAYGLKALLHLVAGRWDEVASTIRDLRNLVESNPSVPFCLIGASGVGYGAIADVVVGRALPADLDQLIPRLVPESMRIQASAVMVPKVMTGDDAAADIGLRGYEPDLKLWDSQRVWDAADVMPAIALTMLERWTDLSGPLARLSIFARGGSAFASAVVDAVREEEAGARGGPASTHGGLTGLGYAGISHLLHFRPKVPSTVG